MARFPFFGSLYCIGCAASGALPTRISRSNRGSSGSRLVRARGVSRFPPSNAWSCFVRPFEQGQKQVWNFELDIDPDVEQIVEIAVHAIAVPTVLQASLLVRQADGARPERPDAFASAATNARVDDAVGAGLTQDSCVGSRSGVRRRIENLRAARLGRCGDVFELGDDDADEDAHVLHPHGIAAVAG